MRCTCHLIAGCLLAMICGTVVIVSFAFPKDWGDVKLEAGMLHIAPFSDSRQDRYAYEIGLLIPALILFAAAVFAHWLDPRRRLEHDIESTRQ